MDRRGPLALDETVALAHNELTRIREDR